VKPLPLVRHVAIPGRIALTGTTGSQAPHSMQDVKGQKEYCWSSSVEWMQSTGHASTHDASFTPMHGSQITYVTASSLHVHF